MKEKPEVQAQSHLPLTHLSYHILLAVRSGPLHGYGIIKAVQDSSEGTLSPGTGTFYSALRRMSGEGLISESRAKRSSDDQRRIYYEITGLGRSVLLAETSRLESLLKLARRSG